MTDMKKLFNNICFIFIGLGITACSNELPFKEPAGDGEGRILKSSLVVDVKTEEKLVRAETGDIDVKDVTVDFISAEDPNNVALTYTYGHMPEVVTLPVGNYTVKAYYGGTYSEENPSAGFSKPYYYGESEEFSVEKDKITEDIEPIVCKLANVKVTILFDKGLVDVIDDQSMVSVNVGKRGTLDFYPKTEESGYFEYVEGSSTLAAEFSGNIDGERTSETKTYDNVKPGNHYRITFKLHNVEVNVPGAINPGEKGNEIKVDASVNLIDLTGEDSNLDDSQNDIYLKDDRYENVDPEPGPDDPVNPPTGDGPTITAENPIDLDDWNVAKEGLKCVLNVHSDTGVTGFVVKINSPTLTDDVLTNVGLAAEFNLITGKTSAGVDVTEGLEDLGLPVGGEVENKKDVIFDVSQFMGLLGIYGAADHKFILTVSDAGGTTVKELKLRTE